MRASSRLQVNQSAASVYSFLADVSNETLWRQSIVGSRYVDADAPELGVHGQTDVQMGSRALTMSWEISHLTVGEYVAWRLDGNPWHGGGSYRVTPVGAGCEIEACLEVRLRGIARVLEPVIGFSFGRGLRADLVRLGHLLG